MNYNKIFTKAIDEEDEKKITECLNNGVDVNCNKCYAIIEVIMKGNMNLLKLLISYGATIEANEKFENSPISTSALVGNLEILKYLYALGGDIFEEDNRPIFFGCLYNHIHIVKYLVSKGALKNKVPLKKRGHYLWACGESNSVEILSYLLKKKDCYIPIGEFNPLIISADRNNFECVKMLISSGFNKEIDLALYNAVKNNNYMIAEYLINSGANASAFDNHLLIETINSIYLNDDSINMVKLLIDNGADYKARSNFILDELHAISFTSPDIVKKLILCLNSYGADIPLEFEKTVDDFPW